MAHIKRQNDPLSNAVTSATDTFVWDDAVPPLAVRTRGKVKTWIVQIRRDGQTVRRKIGDVARVSLQDARAQARTVLADLTSATNALDPEIPLKDFAAQFLADCQHQWKPNTLASHSKCVQCQIVPVLGQITIAALSRHDVVAWRRDLACAAGTKNRALAVLSSMVRHAELLGLRKPGENPCAGLRRHQSEFKAEYLDADGFVALHKVLIAQAETFPRAVPCIRFIVLTGCRSGEATQAQWVQRDGARITLPDAKAGPKSLWLGKPARDLLAGLPRTGPLIFAGDDVKGLSAEMTRFWHVVRAALGRPKLRIHDLRHSYASVAVNMGFDLRIVGGLLGHRDIETTAGYAHLDRARVADASERVGRHLGRAFTEPKPKPKPTPKKRVPRKKTSFERFVTSRLSLGDFCKAEGVNPDAFREGLVAWRIQNGGRP